MQVTNCCNTALNQIFLIKETICVLLRLINSHFCGYHWERMLFFGTLPDLHIKSQDSHLTRPFCLFPFNSRLKSQSSKLQGYTIQAMMILWNICWFSSIFTLPAHPAPTPASKCRWRSSSPRPPAARCLAASSPRSGPSGTTANRKD